MQFYSVFTELHIVWLISLGPRPSLHSQKKKQKKSAEEGIYECREGLGLRLMVSRSSYWALRVLYIIQPFVFKIMLFLLSRFLPPTRLVMDLHQRQSHSHPLVSCCSCSDMGTSTCSPANAAQLVHVNGGLAFVRTLLDHFSRSTCIGLPCPHWEL